MWYSVLLSTPLTDDVKSDNSSLAGSQNSLCTNDELPPDVAKLNSTENIGFGQSTDGCYSLT